MKCPNCGNPEKARVHVCQACGIAYASEDLLELRQLEFLLTETATWPEAARRNPYVERFRTLKARLLPPEPAPTPPTAVIVQAPAPQVAIPVTASTPTVPKIEPTPTEPALEPVPFDQWLLSERNIKIALYSGGLLLVLAGLIFVGVNWARIPGPVKFAITLMITGLMYLGGYLLFQRPMLKLGGVALLGVASGFLPLNFVVLQIYIFSARGLSGYAMWFIGSLPTLLLYLLTVYWTRSDLFTYLSLAAVVSGLTAALVLLNAPLVVYVLVYGILLFILLLGARAVQPTRLSGFMRLPLLVVSQLAMPILFLFSALLWFFVTNCPQCYGESPWLALAAMLVGVIFYVTTDLAFHWLIARWLASFGFALTFLFLLIELRFSGTATGISLMVLALAYLLVGRALERRVDEQFHGWPLYVTGYVLAAFVSLQAMFAFGADPDDLAKVLIGDVILLAISAWVHRQYNWVYGAAWLFIAPVYIFASLYLGGLSNQGLALGVLMLNYVAAGYALGRRTLKLGGPFLTAAAFLSVAIVALTWVNPVVVSIMLGMIAALYLLGALWLGWSWLLLPALVAVNVVVVTIFQIIFKVDSPWASALTVTYAALGVALTLGGTGLRRFNQNNWAWPLYLAAALNLIGTYLSGLLLGRPLAIGLSAIFGLLAFWLAWVEQAAFVGSKLPPLLTYLGAGLLFIGHFYVIDISARGWQIWPAYTAGLCALFVALAWLLRREPLRELYGTPLRWAGLWLMLVPMGAAVMMLDPRLVAVTFAIAGVTYTADAAVRRILNLGYLGGGAFVIVIWAVLLSFNIEELQAYVAPLGLGLLALGWNERRQGRRISYQWPTILGLLILMGSAFYQSLDGVLYAVLLLAESLVALAWGVRIHSRGYTQFGVLSLLANALAQFGPGFFELSRWIQLGVIGSILLGGGLMALFQREQLLAGRKKLTDEWKRWDS